ncbi:uncharacterized protein THITE_134572 [Thermothielavioides terrestris NRRL 8126]|uniref:PCI domain-containing protein n=1 Tax=Thermothielavioides terrestris (strain ATCC 38088 / NRRL 8126) TaxID=578455 RepID=G2RBR3_THETT|nr:uncharacterized protein THITE_134572 [Thermothielavioides terrestris NRRL 8126]AEO69234.1 hypothetical protein THITE_134572 [Thermothielavioides terrestris NRRL 8126]
MADPLLNFFTLMENQVGVIVRGCLFADPGAGRTRFDRLFLIGRSSVPLCVDALKAAVAEAKRGKDTQRYREAVECLRIAAPSEPLATLDQAWLEAQEMANHMETTRLLTELKGYKNNLIKESIRMGNEDLGKHLESIGDLNAASETYAKMRPDVSTTKQLVDVGKHLVRVSIQRREWGMVSAHLSKLGAAHRGEEEKAVQSYLEVAQGIALLGQEKYKEAALSFLAVDSGVSGSSYNELASQSDVAVYGGLLALASMDRDELQTCVLDNTRFRALLEHAPHIRRAVAQFVAGRYSACIATLESYRPDYLLDLYLQKHVGNIYSQIRSKCITQYLIPFSCVSLDTMSKAFGGAEQPIEDLLADMIRSGALAARIDTIDKLVTTRSANPRAQMQDSVLQAAENYEKQALDRLRRMGLAAADLELKGSKKLGPHGFASQSDLLMEETLS